MRWWPNPTTIGGFVHNSFAPMHAYWSRRLCVRSDKRETKMQGKIKKTEWVGGRLCQNWAKE